MIPRVFAAIERAVPVVRSLVAYECGAVGLGKDRDYESPILRAITCFSTAIEGKTSVCAHLSEMGNLAAACCDNWSNESVQNIKLPGDMAATCYIEQLVCDCRSMNTASGHREESAHQFQRWLVKPDIAIYPQAFILSPESTVKLTRAIVNSDSHYHSGVAAARKAVKPLCIARSQGKLQFEPNEVAGFGKLQYSQGEQPKVNPNLSAYNWRSPMACAFGQKITIRKVEGMTPRERILAILNRKPVDRLPVDLWHTSEIAALLRQHCGVTDDLAMYRALNLDKIVWVFLDYQTATGERMGAQSGTGAEDIGERTMWGTSLKNVQAGDAQYAEFGPAPLQGYDTPESLADYPLWPSVEGFDYDGAAKKAREAARDFAVIGPWVSLFEVYCQLRGMEQSMMDLIEAPELVDAILDRVESIQTEMMRRYFARAGESLNLVFISDDIAGQKTLLMSPTLWKRYLQPRLKRWGKLIHDHGLLAFYHTDGAARPLLGPILDCGVDVLNPIQHACPGMDLEELKRDFGHRVIFHGGVDNQFALPRGTPEDVRIETRRCLETLGAGREGFICSSCHNVQAGTPLENILAMIETVQREPLQ